jgi:diguanylate cyclase
MGEAQARLKARVEAVMGLLHVAREHAIDSPSLFSARFKGEISDIINLYQTQISIKEEVDLGPRSAHLVAGQRQLEREYIAAKEEELKAIINFIADEIRGSAQENEQFSTEMLTSLAELNRAVDISDIRQIRLRISEEALAISRHLERKKQSDARRVRELEEQVSILYAQLGTVEMESKTDGLTALYNRQAFDQQIRTEVSFAKRLGRPLSLILLDIDHFKDINDTLGHQVGDEVLEHLANLLIKEFFRKTDYVARYGGEEFAVIVSQSELEAAVKAAQRLVARVAKRTAATCSGPVELTISAGVTQYAPNESADSLIERVEGALVEAKNEGRNRVGVAEPEPHNPPQQAKAS